MAQRWFRKYDWDALAGIVAAAAALILHLLHLVQTEVVLMLTLVLVALLLLRQLRQEDRDERVEQAATHMASMIGELHDQMRPPDTVLVGPHDLRRASESFARQARGNMVWFNVCLMMFRPQELFDVLLKPAVENPGVARIEFLLDEGERDNWRTHVLPKLEKCVGSGKVAEPRWCDLKESVSFILADRASDGRPEAQLSFWGEPFMARSTGRDVPRYIFHVQAHSELIPRLIELERTYRLAR